MSQIQTQELIGAPIPLSRALALHLVSKFDRDVQFLEPMFYEHANMAREIPEGSLIVINRKYSYPQDGTICAYRVSGSLLVARIRVCVEGVQLHHNSELPRSEVIPHEAAKRMHWCGRVVWVGARI